MFKKIVLVGGASLAILGVGTAAFASAPRLDHRRLRSQHPRPTRLTPTAATPKAKPSTGSG